MKGSGRVLLAVLALMASFPSVAAEIAFSSAADFSEMSLELKRIDDPNPQTVELNVTLSPDAQRRLERATTEGMHKLLQVSINGIQVSSAMVGSVVRGPGLRIGVPREVARNLVPTLLEPLTP
ncbi:hypothetical protein ACTJK3_23300 [Pseudomonas sp. 22105]|jgi:hypothetical protein|uniref:Uncharacterized protein n=1 Tax=Pseudomonas glycinae TaxID=1785145 RepID=A0ABM5ZST2_9PSED|nr:MULTISPECIES: hypothetical protein [Pseudomonas]AMQ85986.1 hypothetical protein AWU82_22555 [Pseudomonas glycinae]AWA38258.1 hypothetical protein DBV33_06505 [Pseudomonas fluorescens]NKF28805.1 hypothetical protein [Pseudomonas sp. BG5]